MGDDSVGIRVAEEILSRDLNRGFEVITLPDSGLNLLNYFTPETKRILIVDTVINNRQPGEFFFFAPRDVATEKELSSFTTHEGDLLKTIEMGRQLDYPIPAIEVMGIEPLSMREGDPLSSTLADRLSDYVRAACDRMAVRTRSS